MGIRFEHQPGAVVGMAAYAAGRGKARQRQQKYALDLLQDDRRLQARRQDQFQGFKYRAALQGMRGQRRLGDQEVGPGTIVDPLQDALNTKSFWDDKAGRKAAVRVRAQQKASARARRMGKPIPYPDAEVTYNRGQTKYERDREDALADYERRREDKLEDTATATTRKSAQDAITALPPIPDYVEANDQRFLGNLKQGMHELLSGKFDLNDPAVLDQLYEAMETYRRVLGQIPKPSVADKAQEGIVYMDKGGRLYDDPGEGRRPVRADNYDPILTPQEVKAAADQEKAEQAEQERVKEQKAEKDRIRKIRDDLKKQLITLEISPEDELQKAPKRKLIEKQLELLDDEEKAAADAEIAALRAEGRRLGGGGTSGDQAGGAGKIPSAEEFAEAALTGDVPPMPAGTPPGSWWVDQNTIQLPSGRRIRPKRGT